MVEHGEERMAAFRVGLELGTKFPRFVLFQGKRFRRAIILERQKILQSVTPAISVPDEENGIRFPFGER